MRIWAFSANYSCFQSILCHFCPKWGGWGGLGYLRNRPSGGKTFLVKVDRYDVCKGAIHILRNALEGGQGGS